jgi:hypothetical protein
MCRQVDLVWTDVWEESVASIFRLEKLTDVSEERVASIFSPIVPSCVYKVSINQIIQSKTRLISHAQNPTHDNIIIFKRSIF